MRIVGILLVSSLMVIPVAASLQIAKSFKQATLLSVLFAELAVILGTFIAYYFELASGGTIVLVSVWILLMILMGKSSLKSLKK
jgi:zinc transport system permease protein